MDWYSGSGYCLPIGSLFLNDELMGGTMKNHKKTITTLLTVAVLLITVFAAGRYGWKLIGFRTCQGAGIESVKVSESTVNIKGFYPGSFPEGFCGYYAEEQDGALYVGFRFSTIFGFFETGNFDVTIPVDGSICKVVLKTKTDESIIWTAESDNSAIPDAPADIPSVLTLPILDEIDQIVTIGTSGSSLSAAALLWGVRLRGSIWAFLGSWLLTMLSTLSIGMLAGGVSKNTRQASVIASVLYFPMLIFSGTTLPIEVMPKAMQKIVSFFPLTQGLTMMKHTFLGISTGSVLLPIGVMVGVAALCTILAIHFFRWE